MNAFPLQVFERSFQWQSAGKLDAYGVEASISASNTVKRLQAYDPDSEFDSKVGEGFGSKD